MRCLQKKWNALFKEETCFDVIKEVKEFNPPTSKVNLVHLDLFNGESKSLCLLDCLDESSKVVEAL